MLDAPPERAVDAPAASGASPRGSRSASPRSIAALFVVLAGSDDDAHRQRDQLRRRQAGAGDDRHHARRQAVRPQPAQGQLGGAQLLQHRRACRARPSTPSWSQFAAAAGSRSGSTAPSCTRSPGAATTRTTCARGSPTTAATGRSSTTRTARSPSRSAWPRCPRRGSSTRRASSSSASPPQITADALSQSACQRVARGRGRCALVDDTMVDALTRIKRWPGWVALALVAVGLLAVGASRSSGPRTADERLEYVSTRLACPICDGESVFESRNTDSEAIRTEIRSQIGQGQLSDDQIITYMTDRYGAQLLLVPKATGVDALVWALPAAALVCALVGLAFAFRRWRRAVDTDPRRRRPRPGRRRRPAADAAVPSARPTSVERQSDVVEADGDHRPRPPRRAGGGAPFLLRSIDDLEREHDAGDVDEHDFAALRDGYVARAAAVLREIDEGKAALPPKRRRPGRASSPSSPSPSPSPRSPAGWSPARPASATTAPPPRWPPADEVTQQLSLARSAPAAGDAATAIQAYQRVLQLDPQNIEAQHLRRLADRHQRRGRASRADFVDARRRPAAPRDRDRRHLHRRPLPARRRRSPASWQRPTR